MKYFVVCPRGLELPLYEELQSIVTNALDEEGLQEGGLSKIQASELSKALSPSHLGQVPIKPTGGIEISGSFATAMAINLHSRIASRVLLQLTHQAYKSEDDIYKVARTLHWEDWMSVEQTIRVDVTAQRSNLQSMNFITLRIKDAVCDRFREITGERPSIETGTPDVRIMAFIDATHVSIYVDTSGEALFKRGWRDEKGAAPLKENLAAGILALTGWHADLPLYDPMCGSGTFLIEAAQIARHIPPGAIRAGIMEALDGSDSERVVPIPKKSQARYKEDAREDPQSDDSFDDQTSLINHINNNSNNNSSTKPVWVAPILVETGQPIPLNTPAPLSQNAKNKEGNKEELNRMTENPPKHNLRTLSPSTQALPFKPSRVDLVGAYQGFGFLRLKPFMQNKEREQWELMKHAAQLEMQRYQEVPLMIAGSDINEQMVRMVRNNWKMARLAGLPNVRQIDASSSKAPFTNKNLEHLPKGVMLFNPPYGERIDLKGGSRSGSYSQEEDEENFVEPSYPEKKQRGARDPLPKNFTDPAFVEFLTGFGRHLKEQFAGWQIDVLTADMGLPGQLRMKETKRTPLFNGSIECRLFRFEIREFKVQVMKASDE